MLPEKLKEIMKQDGVVAIATLGEDGPPLVNTWNSYIRVSGDGRLLIPAGYMHKTEANVAFNNLSADHFGQQQSNRQSWAGCRISDQRDCRLHYRGA
jgi:roadblock/LC7 domain-containing protein